LVPVLCADALLFSKQKRARVVACGLPAGLALLLTLVHFSILHGGVQEAIKHFASLGSEAKADGAVIGPLSLIWWKQIGAFMISGYGYLGVALVPLAIAIAAWDRSRTFLRMIVITFLFGLLNQFLLSRYAFTHSYWVTLFVPMVALCAGIVARRAFTAGVWQTAAVLALVTASATMGIVESSERFHDERGLHDTVPQQLLRTAINQVANGRDVVLTNASTNLVSMGLNPLMAYGPVASAPELQVVKDRFLNQPLVPGGRVLFLLLRLPGTELLDGWLTTHAVATAASPFPGHLKVFILD
jgi:hypothetical protein